MTLLILAFIAGILTVAAPCILPLLPVVIGGSVSDKQTANNWRRPLVITLSLAGAVIVFTLLLKASTALLGVPQIVWQLISGGIVLLLGITLLFPNLWEWLAIKLSLQQRSSTLTQSANRSKGIKKDIVLGAALGPVFSSCSPTYALIVAAVLPESFLRGLLYLIAYALGLASVLLLIAFAGQGVVSKLSWASNPHGWFRRSVGVMFVVVGLAVLFGFDKDFQAYVLKRGWYDPVMRLEQAL
ncbi:MAG: sulfite exporter TauE/SafE family protein [bacterium]|nr:sulfite exporter TauE/SafE family protein [bacterium]